MPEFEIYFAEIPFGFGITDPLPDIVTYTPFSGPGNFRNFETIGDVNGDGVADFKVRITVDEFSVEYREAVVYGTATGFPSQLDFLNLSATEGFYFEPELNRFYKNQFGRPFLDVAVFNGGDLDGDGQNNILFHAYSVNGNGAILPVYFIMPDISAASDSVVTLDELRAGNGLEISGIDTILLSGIKVESEFDFNNDGIDDLLLSTDFSKSYIFYGSNSGLPTEINVNTMTADQGTILYHDHWASYRQSHAVGDLSGDGIDDFLIFDYYRYRPDSFENGECSTNPRTKRDFGKFC